MKKVFELLGLARPIEGDFGIEIEAEGEGMRAVDNRYWQTENDGSLRGRFPESCAEFVLKKPIPAAKVTEAIQNLQQELEGAKFEFSFRTSVHVHVNVQDLPYEQLLNMMYVYFLLEEPLTTYCGRERKGNRFCLRLNDAEGMLDTASVLFRGYGHDIQHIDGDRIRYSAMNLAALSKYGSLEFRAMHGNLDLEVIQTWCSALHSIREYAKSKKNPMEIYEEFRKNPPSVFLKAVLGDCAEAFLYPRVIRDLQRSFSISLDLPFQYQAAEDARKKGGEAKAMIKGKAPVRFAFDDVIEPRPPLRRPAPARINDGVDQAIANVRIQLEELPEPEGW